MVAALISWNIEAQIYDTNGVYVQTFAGIWQEIRIYRKRKLWWNVAPTQKSKSEPEHLILKTPL